jgi:hypothetical protein
MANEIRQQKQVWPGLRIQKLLKKKKKEKKLEKSPNPLDV